MSNDRFPKTIFWRRSASIGAAAAIAPGASGVYAYAEASRVHGLPTQLTWVYVGKALQLDRRLGQHHVSRERHAGLRDWLHQGHDREVWYAEVPAGELDQIERDLICALKPRLNRIRYTAHAAERS